jgi:predicted ATPase
MSERPASEQTMSERTTDGGSDADRFVVVTGGPGSGKTTLIRQLRRLGFATSAEAGRAIIQEQVAIGGRALPWVDPELFTEMILSWEMRWFRIAAQVTGPVFFDRGVPDAIGGFALMGLPVPAPGAAGRRARGRRPAARPSRPARR